MDTIQDRLSEHETNHSTGELQQSLEKDPEEIKVALINILECYKNDDIELADAVNSLVELVVDLV